MQTRIILLKSSFILIVFLLMGNLLAQADLSISSVAPSSTPTQWSSYQEEITLQNDGPEVATNVVVDLPRPEGVVYLGGNETTQTAGTFEAYGAQQWVINSLAVGESETITIRYFLNSSSAPTQAGEILSVDQPDPDSTPGNGVSGEDDTLGEPTGGGGGGGTVGTPDLRVRRVLADDGPGVSDGDVNYSFWIVNGGNGALSAGAQVSVVLSTDGNPSANDFFIRTHSLSAIPVGDSVLVSDVVSVDPIPDGRYFMLVTADPLGLISELNESNNRSFELLNIRRNPVSDLRIQNLIAIDSTSAILASAYYSFEVRNVGPEPTNLPTDVRIAYWADTLNPIDRLTNVHQTVPVLAPGEAVTFSGFTGYSPPGPNSRAVLAIVLDLRGIVPEIDESDNQILLRPGATTALPPSQVDVSIDFELSDPSPNKYDIYSLTVTMRNEGPGNAGNVKVSVPKPAGVSYVGGNEFTKSRGIFDPYGSGIWRLNNVSAGNEETLILNYFLIEDSIPVHFGQVIEQGGTDIDSSPNNAIPPNATEDDEAVTGEPIAPPPAPPALADLSALTLTVLPDTLDLVGGDISYQALFSNQGDTVAENTLARILLIDNANNSVIDRQETTVIVLAIGDTSSVSGVFSPAFLAEGSYSIALSVDPSDTIDEDDDTNNDLTSGFVVSYPAPPTTGAVGCEAYRNTIPLQAPLSPAFRQTVDFEFEPQAAGSFSVAFRSKGVEQTYLVDSALQSIQGLGVRQLNRLFDPLVGDTLVVEVIRGSNFPDNLTRIVSRWTGGSFSADSVVLDNFLNLNASVVRTRVIAHPAGGFYFSGYVLGGGFVDYSAVIARLDSSGQWLWETRPFNSRFVYPPLSNEASLRIEVNPITGDFICFAQNALREGLGPQAAKLFVLSSDGEYRWDIESINGFADFAIDRSVNVVHIQELEGFAGVLEVKSYNLLNGELEATSVLRDPITSPSIVNLMDGLGIISAYPTGFVATYATQSRRLVPGKEDAGEYSRHFIAEVDRVGQPMNWWRELTALRCSNFEPRANAYFTNPIAPVTALPDGRILLAGQNCDGSSLLLRTMTPSGNYGVSCNPSGTSDLAIRHVSNGLFPSTTPIRPDSLTVTYDLINRGEGNAPSGSLTRLLFSVDNLPDTSDILLGEFNESTVRAAELQAYVSRDITLPVVPDGYYYILVIPNADGALNEPAPLTDMASVPILIQTPTVPTGLDLELTASSASPAPPIYQINEVFVTLENTGDTGASGIAVEVPLPQGVVYQGGNEFIASQGSFTAYGDHIWSVGDLAAGEVAELTLRYFSLSAGYEVFAQVTACTGDDIDSTPDNGTAPTATEDDEVFLNLNPGALGLRQNFTASPRGQQVQTYWRAATTESEAVNYEVERLDHTSNRWLSIGTAFATSGVIDLFDVAPEFGQNDYRLVTFFGDGSPETYSEVESVTYTFDSEAISVFPNPTESRFTIHVPRKTSHAVNISVVNSFGQVLRSREVVDPTITQVTFAESLPSGSYFVNVQVGGYRKTMPLVVLR